MRNFFAHRTFKSIKYQVLSIKYKIILLILPILYTLYFIPHTAYAESICPPSDSQFANLCKLSLNNSSDVVSRIVTILLIVAVLFALIFFLWGAIRWIMSGGDKGKVDEARKAITASIIGLILAFVAYFILNIILFLFTGSGSTDFNIPTLVP